MRQALTVAASLLFGLGLAADTRAQTPIVLRETYARLPINSSCRPLSPYRTVCTEVFFDINTPGNIGRFENQPVEIAGTLLPGNCQRILVQSITPLAKTLSTRLARSITQTWVRWYAGAPFGDAYILLVDGAFLFPPLQVPGVNGVLQMDLSTATFVGIFTPPPPHSPISWFYEATVPNIPIFSGVKIYSQAVVFDTTMSFDTTNLDCFTL